MQTYIDKLRASSQLYVEGPSDKEEVAQLQRESKSLYNDFRNLHSRHRKFPILVIL